MIRYKRNGNASKSGDLRFTLDEDEAPSHEGRAVMSIETDEGSVRLALPRNIYADAGSGLADADAIDVDPASGTVHRATAEAQDGGAAGEMDVTGRDDVIDAVANLPGYGRKTAEQLWDDNPAMALRLANA